MGSPALRTSTWRWLLMLGCLVTVLGCADSRSPSPAGEDAGRDAPDAEHGGVDAGPVPCELGFAGEPTVVFETEPEIRIDSPRVVFREGGFEVLARHVHTPPSAEVFHRRMDLDAATVELGPTRILLPEADGPFFATARDDIMAVCTSSFERVHLFTYFGSDVVPVLRPEIWTGYCLGIAGDADRWMIGAREPGSTVGPLIRTFDGRGEPLDAPTPAVPSGPGAELATVAIEVIGNRFLWASSALADGTIVVGSMERDVVTTATLSGGEGELGVTAPALAPWPHVPGHIAIATFGPEGFFVVVVDSSLREVLRTEPLAPAFFWPVSPAVVATPFGLLVSIMSFEELDPQRGRLEVHVIDADGASSSHFGDEVQRSTDLDDAGIDAATDATHVVLHHTGFDDAAGAYRTEARVVGCR